jgi:hypothetical protein
MRYDYLAPQPHPHPPVAAHCVPQSPHLLQPVLHPDMLHVPAVLVSSTTGCSATAFVVVLTAFATKINAESIATTLIITAAIFLFIFSPPFISF